MEDNFRKLKIEEIMEDLEFDFASIKDGKKDKTSEDQLWFLIFKITKCLLNLDRLTDVYSEQILQMRDEIKEIKEEINKLKN